MCVCVCVCDAERQQQHVPGGRLCALDSGADVPGSATGRLPPGGPGRSCAPVPAQPRRVRGQPPRRLRQRDPGTAERAETGRASGNRPHWRHLSVGSDINGSLMVGYRADWARASWWLTACARPSITDPTMAIRSGVSWLATPSSSRTGSK